MYVMVSLCDYPKRFAGRKWYLLVPTRFHSHYGMSRVHVQTKEAFEFRALDIVLSAVLLALEVDYVKHGSRIRSLMPRMESWKSLELESIMESARASKLWLGEHIGKLTRVKKALDDALEEKDNLLGMTLSYLAAYHRVLPDPQQVITVLFLRITSITSYSRYWPSRLRVHLSKCPKMPWRPTLWASPRSSPMSSGLSGFQLRMLTYCLLLLAGYSLE
jgi:hypothetical protein